MSRRTPHIPETRGRKNAPYIEEIISAIESGQQMVIIDRYNVNSARVCVCRNAKLKRVLNRYDSEITTRIIDGKLRVYIIRKELV